MKHIESDMKHVSHAEDKLRPGDSGVLSRHGYRGSTVAVLPSIRTTSGKAGSPRIGGPTAGGAGPCHQSGG
jgi:hypothetical protein